MFYHQRCRTTPPYRTNMRRRSGSWTNSARRWLTSQDVLANGCTSKFHQTRWFDDVWWLWGWKRSVEKKKGIRRKRLWCPGAAKRSEGGEGMPWGAEIGVLIGGTWGEKLGNHWKSSILMGGGIIDLFPRPWECLNPLSWLWSWCCDVHGDQFRIVSGPMLNSQKQKHLERVETVAPLVNWSEDRDNFIE